MPQQNPSVLGPVKPTGVHSHRAIYFILAIVAIVAVAAGLLITIKNFNTEQDTQSTVIPDACTSHGSALACSKARASTTQTTTKAVSKTKK